MAIHSIIDDEILHSDMTISGLALTGGEAADFDHGGAPFLSEASRSPACDIHDNAWLWRRRISNLGEHFNAREFNIAQFCGNFSFGGGGDLRCIFGRSSWILTAPISGNSAGQLAAAFIWHQRSRSNSTISGNYGVESRGRHLLE